MLNLTFVARFVLLPALFATALTACAQDGTYIKSTAELRGKKILIVTGEVDPENPSDDELVAQHLREQGYVVTMAKDDDAAVTDGEDLIILSSTADPRVLGGKYARSTIPVFTWNTVDYPDMRMTGPERHVDFETLNPEQDYMRSFSILYGYYTNVTTPIVRAIGIPRSEMFGTLYLEPQAFGWGKASCIGRHYRLIGRRPHPRSRFYL